MFFQVIWVDKIVNVIAVLRIFYYKDYERFRVEPEKSG